MVIKVRLNNDTYNTLCMFGDINNVVNKILESVPDVMRKPVAIIDKQDSIAVNINITNEDYLNLVQVYGIKSNVISIGRLLEWFVTYEIYDELGWQPCNNFKSVRDNNLLMHITRTQTEALKLSIALHRAGQNTHIVDNILTELQDLEVTYGKRTD